MLTSGDVVDLDLGVPAGREAGFRHPAVVVTGQRVLDAEPSVIHVVPLTSSLRDFASEVSIVPDDTNGLGAVSSAQCQHIRSVASTRVERVRGNVGGVVLRQVREMIAAVLNITI